MGVATQRRLGRALLALGVLAVVVAGFSLLRPDGGHRVLIDAASASGVIVGMDVKAAGRDVGHVEKAEVDERHRARLVLALDDAVWPLPVDTAMQLRTGGTIKFTDRFIEVRPGHSARVLRDGGTLAPGRFTVPVEFDQLFGTFDTATRRGLRATLDTGGVAIGRSKEELAAAIDAAPPAVRQARGLFDDLGTDEHTLATLVRSTADVAAAADRAAPGIGELINGAAGTFRAVASESHALQSTLTQAPAVLRTARTTLKQADTTLTAAGALTDRLGPGVADVRRLGAPLDRVLASVQTVGPDARRALATTRRASPDLDAVLSKAQGVLPTLGSVGREAAKQLDCVRPYTPEIAGFASTWGPGAWGTGDTRDKYLRAEVGTYPMTNANVLSTGQVTDMFPGLKMAFPQPPGVLVNQPWFLPQCGITADALNPHKDPESQAKQLYPKVFLDRTWADPEAGG